jgi:hypothetical protein
MNFLQEEKVKRKMEWTSNKGCDRNCVKNGNELRNCVPVLSFSQLGPGIYSASNRNKYQKH